MSKKTEKLENERMNEEAHEAIARLASVDLGNPLERIVAREAAKRGRMARYLSDEFELNQAAVEAALMAFEEQEDQAYLAR